MITAGGGRRRDRTAAENPKRSLTESGIYNLSAGRRAGAVDERDGTGGGAGSYCCYCYVMVGVLKGRWYLCTSADDEVSRARRRPPMRMEEAASLKGRGRTEM